MAPAPSPGELSLLRRPKTNSNPIEPVQHSSSREVVTKGTLARYVGVRFLGSWYQSIIETRTKPTTLPLPCNDILPNLSGSQGGIVF